MSRRQTLDSLVWGLVGGLAFLVLVQGYGLLGGQGFGVAVTVGVAVAVTAVVTVATRLLAPRLAEFAVPATLEVVDELPESGPGKVDRAAVEERFGPDGTG